MKLKQLTTLSGITLLGLVLSGCVRTDKNGHPYGMVYNYLAKPMQHFMEWVANLVGGNYGWAIIILTIIIRLILFPIMFDQMKKSTLMQERMAKVQPQLKALQERQRAAKTPEEQAAVSQEMMSFYRNNNISLTGGIGCLPLLIQLPIFAALYAAIRYSPELSSSTFFGIQLGHSSAIMAILAFVAYLIQGYLSLLGVPKEQQQTMKTALLMSPIMILFISWTSSAGLGLYFFIGGIFAIFQTLIINIYRPHLRKQIDAEMANQPVVTPSTAKDITADAEETKVEQPKLNRNAGKQKSE
ncbi:membrane protein insertase YidC [Limosilactobacillus equigenerosi]|uniref:Membrane protein insertase YidC n=1 Tax=Limosilactobacillus equigenerosi DSM 18793 = JCM 14505 TaxID=1423742 RepID=A0A0R1URE0_9LACO|nr:membrane protein insertase YidC [Limosilactobacillus equigenerosi]KRL95630.1 hypothetical protein FC21_GL000734 [Limosilactobacillus equigenerosi DSM 18793 = JCM 14505]